MKVLSRATVRQDASDLPVPPTRPSKLHREGGRAYSVYGKCTCNVAP